MKKLLKEIFTYFWIPLIIGLVSYIFLQLHDVVLGIVTLVALSAAYTTIQLFFLHKKWWLGIIVIVLALIYVGFFIFRAPTITLSVNGQRVNSALVSFSAGSVAVSPAPQTNYEYTKNTRVTVTANPAPGFDFTGWQGTDDDADNPATVTMSRNKHITAVFVPRLSLIINNQLVIGSLVSFNEGSVLVDPPPGGDGKYSSGTVVSLTARPNQGYDWGSWLGTGGDTANPTSVSVTSDKHLIVNFEPRFSLTINSQLVIGPVVSFNEGSVLVDPPPGDDGKYASGTVVTLTDRPGQGYDFASWLGTGNDASNPSKVTLTSDKHLLVNFDPRFPLTVNLQPVAGPATSLTGGTLSASPAPGADGLYTRNVVVSLSVSPAAGYRFDHWAGAAAGITNPVKVTMDAAKGVTVVFIKTWTLTTTSSPAAGGSVSPGATYDDGTSVTLTANAATGYRFDHWSGAASGTSSQVKVTMDANKSVTAVFIKTWTLTTAAQPAAGGSVSPGAVYGDGTPVTLTATAAAGYRFDHWSGDASGTTNPVTVTMNANKSVTAVFIKTWTLTTASQPAAGGAVPAGATYDDGTVVTLTATAAAGYRFDHWSGAASGNTNPVTVTMDANKSVTAVFIKTWTLITAVQPAGGGLVSAGSTYDDGTVVTLTATASPGYHFDHWSGDASGTTNPVTVTMNANKSVTAVFAADAPPPTSTAPASFQGEGQNHFMLATVYLDKEPVGPVNRSRPETDVWL